MPTWPAAPTGASADPAPVVPILAEAVAPDALPARDAGNVLQAMSSLAESR